MRRASYVDTNIDYDPREEKLKKYKVLLRNTEIKWQKNWFNNLMGDKQQEYKDQITKMKTTTPKILWKSETEKIQVDWKRNWLKNLTEEKKEKYYTEINKIKEQLKQAHNFRKEVFLCPY